MTTERSFRVGMPATLYLHEFGSHVWAAFGSPPYLVGSALGSSLGMAATSEPHDVDVRMILADEEYEALGLGDPRYCQRNPKWVSLVMAYSALGTKLTGLPIDFQIQQQTDANTNHTGPRSALGFVPWRMADAPTQEPIPMLLNCPICMARHIDAPEPETGWTNPPHKSHLCHQCGTVWRVADIPTVGVWELPSQTRETGQAGEESE